jgi:hypothetical protein
MLRVNEYVNTVQNDTSNGWDDGATDDGSSSQPEPGSYASTWDMLIAGDIDGLYEKASDNPISRSDLWKNDIKPGIVDPFITGASQAVNEWSRAQQQETDAFEDMIDNIATGADQDAVNSSINNYNDASQYVTDAGELVMKGPLSLIPSVGVGTFVGDAINKGIEDENPFAAIRAATYGPAVDYASQDNLMDKIIERPVTTLGEGAMSILPLVGAGYVGYKGGKAVKGRYNESIQTLDDMGGNYVHSNDGVTDDGRNGYTNQTPQSEPEPQPEPQDYTQEQPAAEPAEQPTFSTGVDSNVDAMVANAAAKYQVDPALLAKLVDQESTYGRDANAGGNLAQISDDLARQYGLDSSDPAQSIEGGARYLKEQLDNNNGDVREALAAYNGGPGAPNYNYADQVLARDIGGEMGKSYSGGGNSGAGEGAYEAGADAWMGATMPHGSEGCVEAATRVGSFYDGFLKDEAEKGVASVPQLISDAGDRFIPFDESRLEKGDIIVYGGDEHVVTYDGKGGYVGNSTSQGHIVHGGDYHAMGGMEPTGIIKASDKSGGGDGYRPETSSGDDAPTTDNGDVDVFGNKLNEEPADEQPQAEQPKESEDAAQPADNAGKPADVDWGDDTKPQQENIPPERVQEVKDLDSYMGVLQAERQRMIDEEVKFYKDTPGGKGTQTGTVVDDTGRVTGRFSESYNPQWYQDAYKYFKGKPPKSRLPEFAEDYLSKNSEEFSKIDLQIRQLQEYRDRITKQPAADSGTTAKQVLSDIRYSKPKMEEMKADIDRIVNDNLPSDGVKRSAERTEPQDSAGEPKPTDGTITMRQIYKRAQELYTPIRTGRVARGTKGTYSPHNDVVRSRSYGDLSTVAHELGHALDERLNLSGSPIHNKEFSDVVYKRFGKDAYKPEEIPGEGVAEFMHDYLQDPKTAQKNFPDFYKKFTEKMEDNPKDAAKVNELRDMVQKYNGQSAEARGRSAVSYGYENKPGIKDKIGSAWHTFVEGVVDDKDAIQRAQESYDRLAGKKSDTDHNAYKQARLAMNSATARAQMMVEGKKSVETKESLNKVYGEVAGDGFKTIKDTLSTLDRAVKGKYDDYLKRGGYKNWHEALDSLLVARRSTEVKQSKIRDAQDAHFDIEQKLADTKVAIADLLAKKKELAKENGNSAEIAKINRRLSTLNSKAKVFSAREKSARRDLDTAKNYHMAVKDADAKAIIDNAPQELTDAAKSIYHYNDTVLHILANRGMISQKAYKALKEKYHNYVPLARDFSDEAGVIDGFGAGSGFANVAKALKSLSDTGSTRQVMSPLESMVKNTYKLLSMAERNKVGQVFADWSKTKGAGKLVEEVTGKAKQKDSTFKVWIDGKEHVYATTPELYGAIMSMNKESANILTKLLSPPAGLLRAGATLTPDFALKNIMRDSFGAAVFSRYGFRPVIDHIAGIFHMVKQDQLFQDYKASGALMSTMVGLDRDFVQASLKGLYKKNATYYWKNYNPVQILRGFSEMLETATRLGEYNRAIKKGASMDDAALSARDISLDFSKAGSKGRQINKVSAFFNAGVQEPARIFEAFKEAPAKTTAKTALYITLPSIALWTINHNQEWYQETPDWEKNTFWMFKAGGTIYRIPKPFGLGVLFGSLPERTLDWLVDKHPQGMSKWLESFKDAFLPNLAPTAAVPIIEWMTNYSFFRNRSVVPGRLQKLPDAQQFGPNTSEIAKYIGKTFKLSPMKIDNLIRGYGAGMATQTLNAMDAVTGHRDMKNPFKAAFTADPMQSPQSIQDFYDKLDETEKAYNGAGGKSGAKGADKYNYQLMQHANRVMQDLNKQERAAGTNQSKIDDINAKQLKAARDALKLLK